MGESVECGAKLYSGRTTSLLDDKSRLTIPIKYRRFMQPSADETAIVWLIPGDGFCDFKIMDKETGDRWASALSKATVPGAGKIDVRELLAIAEQVEIDKAGRVLLSKEFVEDIGLAGERELGIAGKGDCLDVYGAEKWAAYRAQQKLSAPRVGAWASLRDKDLIGNPAGGGA